MDAQTKKRLVIFLTLAFGISWATALTIYLTGGLGNSPVLSEQTGITLAYVLLITTYMWGPALAHLLTRLLTREGWQNLNLKTEIKSNWQTWLIAWVSPAVIIALGVILYFALFPAAYDSQFQILRTQISLSGQDPETFNMPQMIISQVLVAILISPLLNAFATFGDEFGWRGYLLPKLQSLGTRQALLLSGLIWGIWHAPLIAMGYNYSFDYPGAPWVGMLVMVWATLGMGVLFGWLALRAGNLWPAVIAHGALNGFGAIGLLFLKEEPNLILGPSPVGFISSLPFIAVALWILFAPRARLSKP